MSVPAAETDAERLSALSWTVLKWQLPVLAVTAVVLGTVVVVLYLQDGRYEKGLREQQGQHRLDVAVEFISRDIRAVRSDLLYLAGQESLKRFLSGDPAARAENEREYARFARRKEVYDQIRCLDITGKEIIRVNFRGGEPEIVPESDLQDKEDRYYFRQSLGLERGEVFVSEFDLNVEHGVIERPLKPVIRFVTPAFDAEGEKRGMLVLNYLGSQLLQRLNQVSLPGSTLLVNAEGEYLRGFYPDDAWGWILGHDRNFAIQFPEAWKQIGTTTGPAFQTGRGLFVFRRITLSGSRFVEGLAGYGPQPETGSRSGPLRDASLALVSYLPADEVYADSRKLLWKLCLTATGAMLLVLILSKYWAFGAAVREEQARRIADSELRLRALSTQLFAAQEDERRAISREIHDELGQQVTAISLELQMAARQQDFERTREMVQRAIEETEQLLHSLHEIASQVRPVVLDDLGLHDAVETFLADYQRRTGITVDARLNFQADSLPGSIGENAFRVLQEALTNVAKHAHVEHVSVMLEENEERLRMTVEDEGAGFDPQQLNTSRLGILGMQERVELLGGRFELQSAPEKGTRIEVSLPLHNGA